MTKRMRKWRRVMKMCINGSAMALSARLLSDAGR